MTIRPSLVAFATVFTMALFMTPSVHAAEKSTTDTSKKSSETKKNTTSTGDKKSTATKKATKKPKQVTVTVQTGDTLTSIADAHSTTYVRLFNANQNLANPDIINVGDKIRIPASDEQLPDRMSAVAAQATATPVTAATTAVAASSYEPVYSQTYTPGSQPVYATDSAGNTYFKGYCTWYAKERRPDLPNQLGNGGQWVANAAAQGYAPGSTPKVGAIAETAGHVAYVEAVNPDGTIVISDMNGRAGFGNVGSYTASAGSYQYIY